MYQKRQSNFRTLNIANWLCAVLVLVSTALVGDEISSEAIKAPDVRDQLLMRVERDQAARQASIDWAAHHGVNGVVDEVSLSEEEKSVYAGLQAEVVRIDAENTQWLRGIVRERGWPGYSEVGIDGGDAAWLLVQHADADRSFQKRCLDLMTRLPKNEVSQQSVAYLTDRVLIAEGKNQIYGTQFMVRDGEYVPARLEDAEKVDARRAEVGLPPLAEYKAMLEAAMRGEEMIE